MLRERARPTTPDEILAAIREWTERFGEPPCVADWSAAQRRRSPERQERHDATGRYWPSHRQVTGAFGRWSLAMAAAINEEQNRDD